jgi:hypothetical protein
MNGTIGLRSKNAVVLPGRIAPEQIVPPEVLEPKDLEDRFTVIAGDPPGFAEEVMPLRAPPSWTKGQLLNVRNRGEYVVTLLGEEDDPPLRPAPSGALRFTNTALCQAFVSAWYARESHDPRAR